jgi:hypothetical protein
VQEVQYEKMTGAALLGRERKNKIVTGPSLPLREMPRTSSYFFENSKRKSLENHSQEVLCLF